MSSTNRSEARKRHKSDYYVTDIDEIVLFLNEFNKHEDVFTKNDEKSYILDCCAGGDANHPMSYPEALIKTGVNKDRISTVDIREDSLAEIKGDYLEMECPGSFDVVISNPPFSLAKEVIEKALNDVNDNGFVIMLLRLNFLEGKNRFDFWKKQMPKYIFVHHKRMSFTGDGKTDSVAYAHYMWQKGDHPEFSKIKVI